MIEEGFLRPFGAGSKFDVCTHGLRRGLYCFAASRLGLEAHTKGGLRPASHGFLWFSAFI